MTLAQSYRNINRTLSFIMIYGLILPLIHRHLLKIAPCLFPECLSISLFRKPCPLCGLTRGIGELMRGNLTEACAYNILSLPVTVLLLMELIYRGYASFTKFNSRNLNQATRLDLRLHLIMLAVYLVYSLTFIIHTYGA